MPGTETHLQFHQIKLERKDKGPLPGLYLVIGLNKLVYLFGLMVELVKCTSLGPQGLSLSL
jgi:hypothetical protein